MPIDFTLNDNQQRPAARKARQFCERCPIRRGCRDTRDLPSPIERFCRDTRPVPTNAWWRNAFLRKCIPVSVGGGLVPDWLTSLSWRRSFYTVDPKRLTHHESLPMLGLTPLVVWRHAQSSANGFLQPFSLPPRVHRLGRIRP